jgi:hypothetical protein
MKLHNTWTLLWKHFNLHLVKFPDDNQMLGGQQDILIEAGRGDMAQSNRGKAITDPAMFFDNRIGRYFLNLFRDTTNPASPDPSRSMVDGSGTGAGAEA